MRENWVSTEEIEQARKLDLLSYLQQNEPWELKQISPGVYSLRSHDSLKISNGKWFRWSQGVGGVSALDFLIKVRNMDFVSAVKALNENYVPALQTNPIPTERKPFTLPKQNEDNDRVMQYLSARGIHRGLIISCIKMRLLYEDLRHNCVFVGYDGEIAKYAYLRSTDPASTFMQEAAGSDKRYSFSLPIQNCDTLNVFESAIDALSLASMDLNNGKSLSNYLSLSGIYQPKKEILQTPIPVALDHYLRKNPQIAKIYLCFDNDFAGERAAHTIQEQLKNSYSISYTPPLRGKDYNEWLMKENGLDGIRVRASAKGNLHRCFSLGE